MLSPFTKNRWRELMNSEVSPAIDDAFGERLTIIPALARPNFTPQPHYDEAVESYGIFRYRSILIFSNKRGETDPIPVQTRQPIATFGRNKIPFALRCGDYIRRECDGSIFEITSIKPDGVSRIELDLTQMGRSKD